MWKDRQLIHPTMASIQERLNKSHPYNKGLLNWLATLHFPVDLGIDPSICLSSPCVAFLSRCSWALLTPNPDLVGVKKKKKWSLTMK